MFPMLVISEIYDLFLIWHILCQIGKSEADVLGLPRVGTRAYLVDE